MFAGLCRDGPTAASSCGGRPKSLKKGHPRVEFVGELDRPKALELSECVHGGGERSLLVDTEALAREGDFAVFSKLLAAVRDNGTHP